MGDDPRSTLPSGPPPVDMAAHLRDALATQWSNYRHTLERCQKRFTTKSVHRLRVETRRLLSATDLLANLISSPRLPKLRRALKKRLDAFDDLRDAQVQVAYVSRELRQFPELKALHRELRRRQRRLVTPTARKIKSAGTTKLAKRITKLQQQLDALNGSSKPAAQIRQAMQRAFDQVVELRQKIQPSQTETIHRTRIAFKKFRYMAEVVMPLFPELDPERLRAMHDYQIRMGEIQDVEVLMARLDKIVAKKKMKTPPLRQFRDELERRRKILITLFLESADALSHFWPTAT